MKTGKDDKKNDAAPPPAEPMLSRTVLVPKEEYDELVAGSKEKEHAHDRYLRAHAEFENLRKRVEKEKGEFLKYAKEEFIAEFMPILDSIEMASKHIASSKDAKALQEGIAMIEAQVRKFLKGLGVEKVKAVGEKFDPHVHEAMEVVEAPDKEENIVVEELKAGYTLNGKLIRPAGVKIARKKEEKNSGQS